MNDEIKKINLELWDADAVVLYDWLMTTELEGAENVPVSKAQKQALTDLLTQLEQTEVTGVTQVEIDRAAHDVSKDMDWD